nr:unnamed protein product [Callosobruchus chinensis]
MEADTIHAAIEKTKRATTANTDIPRDWANLIRLVPRQHPIVVHEMEQGQFLNFKAVLETYFQHRKVNTDGSSVPWNKICLLQYRNFFLQNLVRDGICLHEC